MEEVAETKKSKTAQGAKEAEVPVVPATTVLMVLFLAVMARFLFCAEGAKKYGSMYWFYESLDLVLTPFEVMIAASIIGLLLVWALGLLYLAVRMGLYTYWCIYRQLASQPTPSRINVYVLILFLAFISVSNVFFSTEGPFKHAGPGSFANTTCVESHQPGGITMATLLYLLNAPQHAGLVLLAVHFSTGLAKEHGLVFSESKLSMAQKQAYPIRSVQGMDKGESISWASSRQLLQLKMSGGSPTRTRTSRTCTLHAHGILHWQRHASFFFLQTCLA